MSQLKCRHCQAPMSNQVLDLGFAPPSNAYLSKADLSAPEMSFPLRLWVCDRCFLVQTEDFTSAESLFSKTYSYFSSTSKSWLDHAARYCAMITERLALSKDSLVVELASNDGYLLKNFVAAGIPCLGIEPTESTAKAAEQQGIKVLREFFGETLAQQLTEQDQFADLVIGNNVYAHVPDINDFTVGIAKVLKPNGVVTLEFPYIMRLLELNQFDTVYHEHFSYLSLTTVKTIFEQAGLRVFDVEELPTHGGSLRVFGCLKGAEHKELGSVSALLKEETARGLSEISTYKSLQRSAETAKDALVAFLIDAKKKGSTVAAYGAAAKGNTLLNFGGVKPDLLPYVCDAAASKQGQFLPGSHIPILPPEVLFERQPDYIVILPWNIAEELQDILAPLVEAGSKLVTAIPELKIQ